LVYDILITIENASAMSQYELLIFNMSDVEPTQRDYINDNLQSMYNRGDLDLNAPLGSYMVLRVLDTKANQVASDMSRYRFRMLPKGSPQYNLIASQQGPVSAIVSSSDQIPQLMQQQQPQPQPQTPTVAESQPAPKDTQEDILSILKEEESPLLEDTLREFTIDLPLKYDNTYLAELLLRDAKVEKIINKKMDDERGQEKKYIKTYRQDERLSELKDVLRKADIPGFLTKVGNIFRSKSKISSNKVENFNDTMTQLTMDIDKDINDGQVLYKKYLLLLLLIHYNKLPEGPLKSKIEPYYTRLYGKDTAKIQMNIDNILMFIKSQINILRSHLSDLLAIRTQYKNKVQRELYSSQNTVKTGGVSQRRKSAVRSSAKRMRRRLKRVS
jgi:hypothetical protein